MVQYRLESHLEQLCKNYPEYTSLLSTWKLNKETCTDALKTVVASYPHFSLHDISHSEAVITKIEMLLGDRVEKLSPTDTWLILHAAYAHDLGMVLKWEDIEKIWKEPKFERFLKSSIDSLDTDLSRAAKSIKALLNCSGNVCFDPLKISRNVTLINAAYFRKYHSEISRKYIDLWEKGLGVDFSHSGLIQSRLIKLLGLICELHTSDSDKVLEMDYQTDGFGSDYAHPRFVAMLLRLGDLLDADNGRFSKTNTMAIGVLPDSSVAHKDKHESTTHLLVTPKEIEFRSDCPNQSAYLETRNFINWLESEIDFLKKNWDLVAPKDLGGYVPRFDKKEVLINGVPDIEGVAGLKFKISQEKAFQIVEGSNIYGDPMICFREIIQNAMDASKIQLWKDLTAGNYAAWIPAKKVSEHTQPFDIDKTIFSNYAVSIELKTLADKRTQVNITDRGTGISAAQFKQMCNVGTSASLNGNNEVFIATMPGWLKPTAGFGIGLQSIFLLVDDFEMITSTGTEAFAATVHSYRQGGFLQLKRKDDIPARGTTVSITFDARKHHQPLIDETRRYIYGKYDPFADEDYIGEYKVIGAILKNCGDLMFPVHIVSSVDEYQNTILIDALNIDGKKYKLQKDGFRYSLSGDCCSLVAWDEAFHIHSDIRMVERDRSQTEICFKGVKVPRGGRIRRNMGLAITCDVYGLETKNTLALDRANFINPGSTIIRDRIKATINFYLDRVLDELNSSSTRLQQICGNEKFDVYLFWKNCSREQRSRIPKECYSYIKEEADIIQRSADGKYILTTKPVRDILMHNGKTYFACYRDYDEPMSDQNKYREICNLLNQKAVNHINEFVIDSSMTSTNGSHIWEHIINPIEDNNLLVYTTGPSICCEVVPAFRRSIIRGLAGPISTLYYYGDLVNSRKYYAIPAVSGYEDIAITQVPRGVAMPYANTNLILAPFTSQLGNKASEMSKEMFIDAVINDARYDRIVAYVQMQCAKAEKPSDSQIRESYRKLLEEYWDTMEESK